jgi:hypothetical protein
MERYLKVFGFRNGRKFLNYYAKKCYVKENKETKFFHWAFVNL